MLEHTLADLDDAHRALQAAPADRLARARARGALAAAREAWPELGPGDREAVSAPAGALREVLDRLSEPPPPASPEELLARAGLAGFRGGQREAVAAALEGRDSLVVMPTGAGKSLCYQLPALAGRGLVVVVSPLIALMADQQRSARERGIDAVMLASGMAEGHNVDALERIRDGSAALVLAAPERFSSAAFREALATREMALFVVDEAHCVAEWGHDFRPDYLRLHQAIAALGRPTVMAATATATPRVAGEVEERLGLRDPVRVRSGFDRPNLAFDVASFEGPGAMARKHAVLVHRLRSADGLPAIVYCGTRKSTEELTAALRGEGLAAVAYHAGLPAEQRRDAQEAFMSGGAEVVVATNAFGMGVDKADVRTVAHWAIPTSLEAYYQEAGRAGRDGEPARALLLASRVDLGRLIRFNTERTGSVGEVRGLLDRLGARARDGVLEQEAPGEEERVLLAVAERAGAVVLAPGRGGRLHLELTGRLDARAAHDALQVARDRGWEAYRAIERYTSTPSCRRAQLLEHFADPARGAPTGRCCDVCDPDAELARVAERTAGRRRSRTPAPGDEGEPVDAADFERLREWRRGRAEDKPAYTVATDATLRDVLRRRPGSTRELLAIRGIGPSFVERHGEALLAELGSRAAD